MHDQLVSITHHPATEAILDSIADGVFTVDDKWRISSFNRAAAQITGMAPCNALGRPCRDVFKANICDSGCALRHTRETGCPIVNLPVQIVNASGHRIPISISTAVLKDEHDSPLGGVETFRDLTTEQELRRKLRRENCFADIISRSPAMHRLFDLLPQVADNSCTVLIQGASGTGKELIARAIHDLSPRQNKPFVAVNCGALPDTLLESELFGYRAGAFTDARHDKPGRFQLAHEGTLLLDEIGDISLAMQAKLLRVLQERVVEPLGGVDPFAVDVRVLAATHRDLEELVRRGEFRQDLYYRIKVVTLRLPDLRDRPEDIPILIDHLVDKFNRLQQKQVSVVSDEVLAMLRQHDYPGNVRELENIIEHAFVLCKGSVIEPRHLPSEVQGDLIDAKTDGAGSHSLRDQEARSIVEALHRHIGHRAAAAKDLGIHPSTLYRKMKQLGIEAPRQDGRNTR